jgi:hypothetical protein
MNWLQIATLGLFLGRSLASVAQEPPPAAKTTTHRQDGDEKQAAIAAKDELWKKFGSDPSVIGVGVGSAHSVPVVYVYVAAETPKETLDRFPKKCHGIVVSVVKSGPLKPQ